MYKFQTLSKEQITNAVLCFADRISCSYCPCGKTCIESKNVSCEKLLIDYLTEEMKTVRSFDYFDGFNEGFDAGYDACKKAIIEKLQKGRKENENTR